MVASKLLTNERGVLPPAIVHFSKFHASGSRRTVAEHEEMT